MVDSTDVRSRTAIDLHTALTLQPSSRPASIVIKVECFLLDVLLLFPLLRVDNTFRNKKTVQVLLHVYNTRCAFLQNVWKGDKKDRFDSQKQQEMSLLENEQTGCETQQPAFHSAGTEGYPISRVQRPRHEADHLPPFITEVKNEWSCISTPHIWLHDLYMDNFTFTISDAILIPGSVANTTFPTAPSSWATLSNLADQNSLELWKVTI